MTRPIAEEEKLESDPELNGEPLQLFPCGGDVLPMFSELSDVHH